MGEDAYRFLLRIPRQLRAKLVQAAADSGLSLNTYIVRLIEQSLEQPHENTAAEARGHALREGRGMSRRTRRRLVVAFVLVALVALALLLLDRR